MNLGLLLNKLEKFTEIPENIKAATNVTKYAVLTRYPGEYDEITNKDHEESIKIARDCLNWVENIIKENM